MNRISTSARKRFLSRLSEPDENGCIIWQGCKAHGYGQISINHKMEYSHRVAWELANGPISDGTCVCHHCDNPSCCNPNHLFLGTQADNMADCNSKSRIAKGEKHGRTTLTEREVRKIRCLHSKQGLSQLLLAGMFGVWPSVICNIINRKTWKHVK